MRTPGDAVVCFEETESRLTVYSAARGEVQVFVSRSRAKEKAENTISIVSNSKQTPHSTVGALRPCFREQRSFFEMFLINKCTGVG